jgi:hypothetical protein
VYGPGSGYSPYSGSNPLQVKNFNSIKYRHTAPVATNEPDYVVNGREAVASNVWLLAPAFIGTGAFFFFTLMSRGTDSQESCGESESIQRKLGSIIFTGIATAGISYYIYSVLIATDGHPLNVFFPVATSIGILILYYAAVYNWLYRIDSKSFTDGIDGNLLNEIVTFIYFSITTFATAGMGDLAPITKTAKILVSFQVLFFVFIFTMGLVFFADP